VVTTPLTPPPTADHDAPFHFAKPGAWTPPAVVNSPPTKSAGPPPDPSSNTTKAVTLLLVTFCVPKVCSQCGSHGSAPTAIAAAGRFMVASR